MTSLGNGFQNVNLSCSSFLIWKVSLTMACAINVEQASVTFDVPTALVTWSSAIRASWNVTNYCHSTELKCGMASILPKQHYMTKATYCISDIRVECVQMSRTHGWTYQETSILEKIWSCFKIVLMGNLKTLWKMVWSTWSILLGYSSTKCGGVSAKKHLKRPCSCFKCSYFLPAIFGLKRSSPLMS